MLDKLNNLLLEVTEKETSNFYIKNALKTYFTNAVKVSIRRIQDGDKISSIQTMLINNFKQSEEMGWKLTDSDEILNYWFRLGENLKLDDFQNKINMFNTHMSKEAKIKALIELKGSRRTCAPISSPKFHALMNKLMDCSIDNVIEQLKISNRIDEMILVFDSDLEKFENAEAEDHDFGDTEDRECIGEFYMEIMKILGFEYSRGVLNFRLA